MIINIEEIWINITLISKISKLIPYLKNPARKEARGFISWGFGRVDRIGI